MTESAESKEPQFTTEQQIRMACILMVSVLRHKGTDAETIRATVSRRVADALQGDKQPESKMVTLANGATEAVIDMEGLFWIVFGKTNVDRSNLFDQERWHRFAMEMTEEEISNPSGVCEFAPVH